jgi:probable O-glycosylation ligase (exosortase A-associated)
MVGIINPLFGLLFLLHIIIFRPESLVWGNPEFGRIHLVAAVCTIIGWFLARRKLAKNGPFDQNGNFLFFLIFIGWLVIVSILAEVSVSLSFQRTWDIGKILIMCFLFQQLVTSEKETDLYLWVIVISFGLMAFWGYLQVLAGNERLDDMYPGGSGVIAAQFVLIMPVALSRIFEPGRSTQSKLIFLGVAFVMVLCTVGTQSRGGFVGLVFALALFSFFTKYRFRILAAVALVVLLATPWISVTQQERIDSIFAQSGERDRSAESRFVLWRLALRVWNDYPVIGVGLDNFSPVKERYAGKVRDIVETDDMYYLIFGRNRKPHGTYTGMLAETGVVGLGLFLLLIARNILLRMPKGFGDTPQGRRLYLQMRAAQAGVIGFCVSAMFADLQYIEMLYVQVFYIGALHVVMLAAVKGAEERGAVEVGLLQTQKLKGGYLPSS